MMDSSSGSTRCRDGQTVVVCKIGGRSAQAVAWLTQQGHDVVNLDGGMLEWARRPADGQRHRTAPASRLTADRASNSVYWGPARAAPPSSPAHSSLRYFS